MRAVVLNCTLKHAPEQSNTELLAQVVIDALTEHGVESEIIRGVDRNVLPGVSTDEGPGDGVAVPGQACTYWNMGPGPGPDYSETDHGHDYSASTGRAAAANLVAVARALAATPIPALPA